MGGNWGNQQDEMHARRPWWFDLYCIWLYLTNGRGTMTDEVKSAEEKANEDTNASIEKLNERGWRPGDGVKASWGAMKDNPGHAVGGAILGQILIPIPVVGAVAGAAITSWWAKKNDPAQNK